VAGETFPASSARSSPMLYQTEREVEVGFANFCGGLYNNGFPEARKSLSL